MRLLALPPLSPQSPMSPLSPLSPPSLTSQMDFNPFEDSANFEQALKSMKDVSDFQLMWSIKKDDLAMKQQLSKMRLLERSQTSCEKDHKLVVESRREMRRITVTIKVVE
ncbi:hypothetical protein F2Q70_00012748 [Brassica cretica]|uniref:Uncharacterized protein n=1 Tax=Brassica cretica TaxID=69181 RepID=A0A8S9MAZ7_BRACR|nr:hypothetical protein F2Q68_00005823 [Brassica cretica]KAF2615091.1 hypothetical protein F2Q70_00012748 [Brassica cretica]